MRRLIETLAICCTLALASHGALANCAGDCGGDGRVTVDELVLGVNIALGNTLLTQCMVFDANGNQAVTVDELISAVNSALNGCPTGNFAGDYAASVTFDSRYGGVINLSAESGGQVSGSLLVTDASSSLFRSRSSLNISFPVGGVSVGLTGTYDPNTGGFEVSGSFVDANGQTVPVTISGDLPGLTGNAPVNVYVGDDPNNVFAATLMAGMLPTPTPTPGPTPPPGNGPRIAFASGLPSHIFVINVDGSGKTQVSTSVGNDSNPAWSPDGTQIAYATPDDNNNHIGIAVINADGSGFHRLAADSAFLDAFPAWSPDGSQIVFTAGGGDAIDVMNADGAGRHRLVTKTAGEVYGHLTWSPDGSRIAFESTRPRQIGSEDRFEIWVMNADGSNLTRLTNNDFPDRHPAWKPDGSTIAFHRPPRFNTPTGVLSISPNGSGESQLINDPFGAMFPAWRHDGTQIAYSTLFGIKVANANGSSAVVVPNTQSLTDFDFK